MYSELCLLILHFKACQHSSMIPHPRTFPTEQQSQRHLHTYVCCAAMLYTAIPLPKTLKTCKAKGGKLTPKVVSLEYTTEANSGTYVRWVGENNYNIYPSLVLNALLKGPIISTPICSHERSSKNDPTAWTIVQLGGAEFKKLCALPAEEICFTRTADVKLLLVLPRRTCM